MLELEAELRQKEQDFRNRLDLLQKELDSKTSQIHKLQTALNRAQTSFQQVALEVQHRLRAKEGVSAEPTSQTFCGPEAGLRSSPRSRLRIHSEFVSQVKHNSLCVSILRRLYSTTSLFYDVSILRRLYSTTSLFYDVSILRRLYSTTSLFYDVSILRRVYSTTCLFYDVSILRRLYSTL
ncbi:hypothetical protein WMY93_018454 [Mugilogobius chulae]|uniref:Uncharacterized protein n=1 Tax=Mugilogobius chulae TaxID=88201 RepID=A0AAW0NIW9_9GOBI